METNSTKYISVVETAKFVRQALKAAFPAITFSVRSKSYSGGASIDIQWTDGPTSKAVERIVQRFEGADFDGMTDLKTYKARTVNGQRVHYGADFIFAHRKLSVDFLTKVVRTYCQQHHVEMPRIKESCGDACIDYTHPLRDTLMMLAYQADERDLKAQA